MPNTPSVFLPYKFLSKGRIVIEKSRRATPWEYWLGETHAPNRPVTLENEQNRGSDSSFRVSEMNFSVILPFYYSIVLAILRDRSSFIVVFLDFVTGQHGDLVARCCSV